MKGVSLKVLLYTIGSALTSAIGYVLIDTKLKGMHLLIVIAIFTGVMCLLTTALAIIGRYYIPGFLPDLRMPTTEQWIYAIAVGVVFSAADILLILAARAGTIPGSVPMLMALTLVFSVILDNILNDVPLKTHYALGITIIVVGIFIIAGGDYMEFRKK